MSALRILAIALLCIYVLIGLAIYLLQESLIFLPESLPDNYEYSFNKDFEEHSLIMKDGAVINALYFKLQDSRGLIVYFHGNAGNLARWGEVAEPFVDLGYEVLISDYRGYGKSTGSRSEKKLLSDAEEIYNFAKKLEREERIVIFGRSLGSAFASCLSSKNNPNKLILETPFYSLTDVARKLFPIYPAAWLLNYRFENHKYLRQTTAPIFIFHGNEDEIVPYESGQKLYEAVEEQATLFAIDGGHHNDLAAFDSYWEHMKSVLIDE
ncbi:alpha/beta hydrolase [Ekhidna sp. MALMAid0563]|uniref:alpha/beta hydrolase n=1 Tax=Ekhidna sp. MALMAid0563 TaxID=3143937 RepID=UPI0032DF0C39